MRLPGGNGRFGNHPLLKVGILMMTLALGFASIVVVVILLDGLRGHVAATKPAAKESLETLVRSYPPNVQPQDEAKPPPEPAPQPEPQREVLPAINRPTWRRRRRAKSSRSASISAVRFVAGRCSCVLMMLS